MSKFPWQVAGEYQDILYHKWNGIAKITINRPEVRNAFRPQTLFDLQHAFLDAREDGNVGVIILTGAATWRFVPAAISAFAAIKATSAKTTCRD